jgi:hypothetical protein
MLITVIDDYDDEAVVDFELFFSGTELEFFTDCAKDCGTRFSCNEFDTSPDLIFLHRKYSTNNQKILSFYL